MTIRTASFSRQGERVSKRAYMSVQHFYRHVPILFDRDGARLRHAHLQTHALKHPHVRVALRSDGPTLWVDTDEGVGHRVDDDFRLSIPRLISRRIAGRQQAPAGFRCSHAHNPPATASFTDSLTVLRPQRVRSAAMAEAV